KAVASPPSMPTTARRLNVSCATASFATISWYWRATAYRCGTAWPASRSAKRSLGRGRNGGHPEPRRWASAISRGKTIHGSLFSSHSPIPTDERGGEDGQGSSGLAARGLVPIKVVFKVIVCEPTRSGVASNKIHGTYEL